MTLLSSDLTMSDAEAESRPAPCLSTTRDERAGYGNCIVCGCGGYSDDGTGDCRCGHSFGQHYS